MSASAILQRYRDRVETALAQTLPTEDRPPARLHAAMRYATLNGGKRLRACLVYASGAALGGEPAELDAPAVAVELIHAYSLVHDDLPCMDDDDLRRGQPTCHKAYDEATALLVGDALQSLAFASLSAAPHAPAARVQMIATLAQAAGSLGMAGGQAIDLAAVGKKLTLAELEAMHALKTGALIRASVHLGAFAAGADGAALKALDDYAATLGLAFQIVDDILDVEGDTQTLGKAAGADAARNKPTYPSLLGLAGAKEKAAALHARALESLGVFGDNAQVLAHIADFIVRRRY